MSQKPDKDQEVETTGHVWDGIEEYNNPLPRWWLWTFYATIIWGVAYTIAYPAWPLIQSATPGLLGFSTRAQVAEDIDAVNVRNAALFQALEEVELASLIDNTELHSFAVNGGAAIFRNNCSQCHGSGAAGGVGFPNLLDDDWLWGGTVDEIAWSVEHGIRNEQSPDAHWSQMTAYGEILTEEEIASVVQFVRQLSGQEHDATLALAGSETYLNECAACHGDEGLGDPGIGAPNISDAIWLYGGDVETLTETVTYARFGIMPAWGDDYRAGGSGLSRAEINAVAAYVHQLGGGE